MASIPEDPTGLHPGIDEAEYHAHPGSLSVSGAKVLLKAPALYRWQQDHPVHRDVFDFGSAAHALVLGRGMESIYVAPYDDWTRRKGPEGGVAYTTDEKRIGQEDGLSVILPKEWQVVCDMADALSSHRLAMRLLSDGEPEVSAFCIDEPTGVMRRSRIDWLGATYIADFKTTADSDPTVLGASGAKWGYEMQAAWYLDIARDLGHPADAFGFIFQMKEPPYLVSVVEFDDDSIERGRRRNRRALQIYRDCAESGLWPGFQADGEITTIRVPNWALREENIA